MPTDRFASPGRLVLSLLLFYLLFNFTNYTFYNIANQWLIAWCAIVSCRQMHTDSLNANVFGLCLERLIEPILRVESDHLTCILACLCANGSDSGYYFIISIS